MCYLLMRGLVSRIVESERSSNAKNYVHEINGRYRNLINLESVRGVHKKVAKIQRLPHFPSAYQMPSYDVPAAHANI